MVMVVMDVMVTFFPITAASQTFLECHLFPSPLRLVQLDASQHSAPLYSISFEHVQYFPFVGEARKKDGEKRKGGRNMRMNEEENGECGASWEVKNEGMEEQRNWRRRKGGRGRGRRGRKVVYKVRP